MNNNLRKQGYIFFPIVYIILFALMIVGTFNDLNIDKVLFNPHHPFAVALANWGMTPQYAMQLFGYSILIACYHPLDEAFSIAESLFPFFSYLKKNKVTHAILFVLHKVMYVAMAYGAFMGANDILSMICWNTTPYGNFQDFFINNGLPKAVAILLWTLARICLPLIIILLLRRVDKKKLRGFEIAAVIGLAIFYAYVASHGLDGIKHHFHRIRFREMVAYSAGLVNDEGRVYIGNAILEKDWVMKTDFSWFTRWYIVGKDNGVIWWDPTSFPSGHTTGGAFAMLLIPISYRLNNKKLFIPLSTVGIVYTALVGISRMMRGAHYLTDVTAAAIIMLTFVLIGTFVLTKIQDYSDKRMK